MNDDVDLSEERVSLMSVPDRQNMRSASYPTLSRILAADARYTPPASRQKRTKAERWDIRGLTDTRANTRLCTASSGKYGRSNLWNVSASTTRPA